MIQAILSNPKRTDLPPVPVCFPISDYNDVYAKLEAIGIGSATKRDCYVEEIIKSPPILKRLEKVPANVDELDYLAKRLDSFDHRELTKFQGVAVSRGYDDITDLINLTFCCQEATIVQSFTDLSAIGREHYMDIHGGVTEDELKTVDFQKTALSLILNEAGNITPYGVIYENGMHLEQIYDGQHFPDYDYDCESVMVVAMSDRTKSEDSNAVTWLYLPMENYQIERAMLRAGIDTYDDMRMQVYRSELLPEIDNMIFASNLSLHYLNEFCVDFKNLSKGDLKKFEAVIQMAGPSSISEVRNLINNLDLFDFIPDIFTSEGYGRHMIKESGHYYSELAEYYDYKKYGEQLISQEYGKFVPQGYISYHGFISLEEVMAGSETERIEMTMGGI